MGKLANLKRLTDKSRKTLPPKNRSLKDITLWLPNPDNIPQQIAYESEADEAYFGGEPGGGKAQTLSSVIITPFGESTMGAMKVGSLVSNPDGTIAKVIQVHPQRVQDVYRVTFIDGASTLVSGSHLWLVKLSSKKMKAKRKDCDGNPVNYRVADTKTLYEHIQKQKLAQEPNWPLIPLSQAVTFTPGYGRNPDPLPIDPYVLGVLLGDGTLRGKRVYLTSADPEIVYEVEARTGDVLSRDREMGYYFNGNHLENSLKEKLTKLGVFGCLAHEKFVPANYKRAAIAVRQELLQGLMDTDGYVDSRGHCHFYSVSEQLALDVQWMARSLGGKATLTKKQGRYRGGDGEIVNCQECYCVYIQTRENSQLFKLPRKRDRCNDKFNGGHSELHRRMIDIELVGQEEVQCITVDHPNGLYLTDDFIVTHNSDLILGLATTKHQRSIIFRREYPQIRGLVERATQIIGQYGKYNKNEKVFKMVDGRSIDFGAVQYQDDVEKFMGIPHDGVFFDEITHFLELQYRFLIGWNRSTDPNQRCRVVVTGNPPTSASGRWVINYWAPWLKKDHPNPAKSGEIRWFASLDGTDTEVSNGEPFDYTNKSGEVERIQPRSRTFVRCHLNSNVFLARTNYKSVLQGLPEPLRSMLLKGDFTAGIKDDEWQLIPTAWVEAAMARWTPIPPSYQDALGVDVARGGDDSTVLAPKHGMWIDKLQLHPGISTPNGDVTARLIILACASGDVLIKIDMLGPGFSPYDTLKRRRARVVGLNAGAGSKRRDRTGTFGFFNRRAEFLWNVRELLDPDYGYNLALPPDDELLAELTAHHWSVVPSRDAEQAHEDRKTGESEPSETPLQGFIKIERKEDVKKKLGRSPDRADAVAYALAETEDPDVDTSWYGDL